MSLADSAYRGTPKPGQFIELRNRRWLVDATDDTDPTFPIVHVSCVDDDAQSESLSVLWDAEIDAKIASEETWDAFSANATDDPETFAAFLRTLQWRTASAADRSLFQAPFRAGIRLEDYQLAPLSKGLRLPRVNLLIADDVGLGKTVEAGLVLRELLLRRRIDFVVVAAPPSMTLQWQDELESKFGLSFTMVDRDRLAELRRSRGFGVNPWATGSRFLVSHRLLTDETYTSGLRDLLGEFRPRSLLILDEAHHAAPASASRYAVDSQFTRAMRELVHRFEHRLFLTATPHNGHSNSFSALLEMLDPQRFTRGVKVGPGDLEPIMVRRLKSDLRRLGKSFPERVVEPIVLRGLPGDAPELKLAQMLASYQDLREERIVLLGERQAGQSRLIFSGLQQRLLSSVAAFAKTLAKHRTTLAGAVEDRRGIIEEAARAFAKHRQELEEVVDADEEERLERLIEHDDDEAVEQATRFGMQEIEQQALARELAAVDAMLDVARMAATGHDARIRWLLGWVRDHCLNGERWNDRRLILFTEFEDTRRWLERCLIAGLAGTDNLGERIGVFSGATSIERREEIKQQFNADPAEAPLRILICTDAAREGINLQTRCADLVHIDLPWNPARLEQRNGRIDRKLQPAKQVFCRYFRYEQRPEDAVLEALVKKTELIEHQLGSFGQVIAERVHDRLATGGIRRADAARLAREIGGEQDDERLTLVRTEMDDTEDRRLDRVKNEIDRLRRTLGESKKKVGIDRDQLMGVTAVALKRAAFDLGEAEGEPVGDVQSFALDPEHRAFHDSGWQEAFDDLRERRRRRGEPVNLWRSRAPLRRIAFEPPVLPDDRNADHVVQVHLEHRLVRRLLGRFLSQGFQSGLNRATVIVGTGSQPRIILLGRVALYGPGAARLHEEILPVTAIWREAERGKRALTALGSHGQETTLDQLSDALTHARKPSQSAIDRALTFLHQDVEDLLPSLHAKADAAIEKARVMLEHRGEEEAKSLATLLDQQRQRILKAESGFDDRQRELFDVDARQQAQLRADRRAWMTRLERISKELETEPQRIRDGYQIKAERREPVGVVYLWPATA
ncbi:MAG: ATP-dependent helicase [Geminicoccaceae bacterium]|nr:ATP-dependent helicase [Geminicoccaceae bacterium]